MRLAAVTVNWNQPELTQRCVRSLLAAVRVPETVCVVDNGSRVDPTAAIHAESPQVRIVRLARNLGFAAGANAGFRVALEEKAEAVLIVNNDATVEPGCLLELERALESEPKRAVVGAKTLTEEEPPRIHTAYGVLTFHGPLVQQRGWMESDITAYDEPREVDYVSGCAMLLRVAALERLGLFDEAFFAYHEDLEWCTRAWKAGYRVVYIPSAIVRHRMHASTGGGYESPITYLSQRNSILFVRKHATPRQKLKYWVHLAVNLVKEAQLRLRRGELRGFGLRLRGLRDGLLGREVPLRDLGLEHGISE